MFSAKIIAYFTYVLVAVCESAFVDTLKKCNISDEECHKKLYKEIIMNTAETGIPEYDIPPLDPFTVRDIPVSIEGLINITVGEATAVGVKDCVFDKFIFNIDKKVTAIEITCPAVTIKGKYKINSSGPVIQNLLGRALKGEGNALVYVEKLKIHLDFAFSVLKRDDKICFKHRREDTNYSFSVLGKTKFEVDNVKLGDQDISKMVVDFINQNAKSLISTFGKNFATGAVNMIFGLLDKFYEKTTTNSLIIDDLSPYVDN